MPGLPDDLDADRMQAALTKRFLLPALPALEAFFLALRAEADLALADISVAYSGKPYPYGCCLEITTEVLRRLTDRASWPDLHGARVLKLFLDKGGKGKMVWGVLRGRFFQNALQLGSLYVDVSNDTVDVRKPKVEILPMTEAGLALVEDGAHFARIAEAYWKVRIYANTALPTLAPAFPMIVVDPKGRVSLLAKTRYMVQLFAADGFRLAKQWLRDGPPPPLAVIKALRTGCLPDVLAENPETSVEAALSACERLSSVGLGGNDAWVETAYALFDQAPVAQMVEATRRNLVDERRANSRPWVGEMWVVA